MFAILILAAKPLAAQDGRVSIGLIGGAVFPSSTAGPATNRNGLRHVTLGPIAEFHYDEHISIGGNFLYGRLPEFNYSFSNAQGPQRFESSGQLSGYSWTAPIIGKYTFRQGAAAWRPFLGAGFALQSTWQHDRSHLVQSDGATTHTFDTNSTTRTRLEAGAVFAAGAVYKRGRFEHTPELRYTRRGNQGFAHRSDQCQALLSIRYRLRSTP